MNTHNITMVDITADANSVKKAMTQRVLLTIAGYLFSEFGCHSEPHKKLEIAML
nr:hypothetical protein [Thalassotalea loyana]